MREHTMQNNLNVNELMEKVVDLKNIQCNKNNDQQQQEQNFFIINEEEKSEDIEENFIAHVEEADEENEQDDLTNLAWLTELRNQRHKDVWQNHIYYNLPINDEHEQDSNHEHDSVNSKIINISANSTQISSNIIDMRNVLQKTQLQEQRPSEGNQTKSTLKRPTPMERFEIFCKKVKRDLSEYEKCSMEFQTLETEKPPFNYSHIIGMVMLEKGRVTLQQICAWIELKFAYFRTRQKWNNSIRHNLSLHPCFRKIDRKKYEKGKGGYWELGIDLKKCERKRIRHRKNVHKQQQQQKQRIKTIKTVTNSENAGQKFEREYESETEMKLTDEIEVNVKEQNLQFALKNKIIMDNEFDVQQNVDVTCCSFHKEHENILLQEEQPQEYQLGTIIISNSSFLSNNKNENNPVTSSASSILSAPCSFISPLQTNWPNYYEITADPSAGTLSNQRELTQESKTINVTIEELQPQCQEAQRSILFANLLGPGTNHAYNNNNIHNNVNNDIYHPEIDSIEEAFQYLRSLDTNNREDTILDTFFDVSVSDF